MQNKVIVIGCYVGGLGVIRSFADKPVDIIALSYEKLDIAHRSKYVKEWYKIPHPRNEETKFIEFLVENSSHWSGAIIFDTDDNVAVALSKNKEKLSEHYKVVVGEWKLVNSFIDKSEAGKIAEQSGVPHPKNYTPRNLDEFRQLADRLSYPILLKPVRGHEFIAKFNRKNFQVQNVHQYNKYVDICLRENQEVSVQEIIPGPDSNIYKCSVYVNSEGNLAGIFFYNKIRQNPPQYGVGRVSVSANKNEEVEKLAKKLLRYTSYKGYCNLEFKKDERDGQLKFIEVNVRMPRMISIATASDCNIPWIIYKDLVLNERVEINHYREDLYWIEIYADILNSVFRHSKEKFSIKEYLSPYLAKHKTFAIYDRRDIMPFILQTMKLPRLLFRK